MDEHRDDYYNLAERIGDAFAEIDSDVVTELAEAGDDYTVLWQEANQIKCDYPVIEDVLNGSGAITLTADEHTSLARYISLTHQMEDIERQAIYFRGHTDCFSYLKKIGAL